MGRAKSKNFEPESWSNIQNGWSVQKWRANLRVCQPDRCGHREGNREGPDECRHEAGRRPTARAGLASERAGALADLKSERAALGAKGRQMETEAVPIRYVAELLGADTHSEKAIRWLIALMVLCCDPLAIALRKFVASEAAGAQVRCVEKEVREINERNCTLRPDAMKRYCVYCVCCV